jgi:hypothetical protein
VARPRRSHVIVADETARQCLHATREKLYGKPTREVEPTKVGEKAASTFISASMTKPRDTYPTTAT